MEDRTLLSTWTTLAPMPTVRSYLAGVEGPDGLNYAIGGRDAATNSLTTVQAYNTGSNTWSTRASMNVARQAPAAAVGNDGKIYVFGGATAFSTAAVNNTLEAYGPAINRWTLLANMPTGRVGLAGATASDGRIYAIDGSTTYSSATAVTTVEAYNAASNTWVTRAPTNIAREFPSAVAALDGRIYVFGGENSSGVLNSVEAYSPLLNKWTFVAPMPTARLGTAAVLGPNGRIFVIGGSTTFDSFAGASNIVESYNPTSNTWSSVVSTPPLTARVLLAGAMGIDGRVYAFGGGDATGAPLGTNQALSNLSGLFAAGSSIQSPTPAPSDPNPTSVSGTMPLAPLPTVDKLGGAPADSAGQQFVHHAAATLSANPIDALFAGDIG